MIDSSMNGHRHHGEGDLQGLWAAIQLTDHFDGTTVMHLRLGNPFSYVT